MAGTLYERGAVAATRRRRRNVFDLRSLGSLVFWGQAEHVTADGDGNVSALLDLSGAGVIASAVQATQANQPTLVADALNGRPVLRFNGTSSRLEADGLASVFTGDDSPFTIISACKLSSLSAAGALVGYGSSSSSTPFGYVGFHPSSTRYFFTRRDDANVSFSTGANNAADTDWGILSFVFNGSTIVFRRGGVQLSESSEMTLGTLTLDRLTIGARRESSASTFWDGDVAEIAICAGALADDRCLAAERAMARRSGLTVA